MRMVDLIQKKRDGHEHTPNEIAWIIENYTQNRIPDEQMSAWAMAVYFQGMTTNEMAELTLQMAQSGEQIDWSSKGISGTIVDKHSTGGVGDKTTLFVAPWAAACGLKMGKMSGRGLGHTGGTIDKLESIPGFNVNLSLEQFYEQVNQLGIALIGQSKTMTPADAKLYALRDVTGTVPSIPLIASSIMSKKIAAGAHAIVLDVKVGSGAFMKNEHDAIQLALAMVHIGNTLGRETIALITNMDQPLGYAIGNALEAQEAMEVLSGCGPNDLRELGLALVTTLLIAAHPQMTSIQAENIALEALTNGRALQVFHEWIEAQGGDLSGFHGVRAPHVMDIYAEHSGFISEINTEAIGLSAMRLGAGRALKSDRIDHLVGVECLTKIGDCVETGQVIARIHGNDQNHMIFESEMIQQSIIYSQQTVFAKPIVIARVDRFGVHKT